ncbi:unnamed protein product [Chironomus riparius]|uniref:Amino acid transporter transmembrane domain-containing protein n=1 Tax=Chironomus riparius TaxID=315576 RepID=A0A9N9S0X4_9DIPT|nr:unnamed protein product [Chironomus riparius]
MILKNPVYPPGHTEHQDDGHKKLSVFFAALCIIDLFGVFPIVTLPKSLISCGVYAFPLILFVFSLQIYTAVVLGRCWVIAEKLDPRILRKNRYPYAAIAEFSYGTGMRIFVTVLLDLTVFGAGIPNLLVASQNLQLLGLRISNDSFNFSFCYFLLIIGLFLSPLMWLGSPKNMRFLASISVCICTSVAVMTWICVYWETDDPAVTPIEEFDPKHPPWMNLLKAYGIIAFQFDIHPMLLTIQVDMQDKTKIGRAVFSGIVFTCMLSLITTFMVFYTYEQSIASNVLESLPKSWTLYVIILLVTLQLCLSSAVGNSALFQHIEDLLGIQRHFNIGRCIVRSILVWLAVFLGELIPKFDLVMGVIGGTLTGPLIFILPPLFYTKLLQLEKIHDEEMRILMLEEYMNDEDPLIKLPKYGAIAEFHSTSDESLASRCQEGIMKLLRSECTLSIVVIVFGILATLTSTFFNMKDFQNFSFWSPCIRVFTEDTQQP